MFGELRGKTGHDFLIWKVKRRVGNYMPKPACLLPSRLGTYEYQRVSLRLQFSSTVVFHRLYNIRMLPKQSLNVIRNMNVIK